MSKRTTLTTVLGLVLVFAFAETASAQFGLSFGKRTKRGHFGITIGSGGFGGHIHRGHVHRRHVHSSCCVSTLPGHWENRSERVWVPGCSRRRWVPATYRWVCNPCGGRQRVVVRAGYWNTWQEGGHYRAQNRRIWVPGHTQYICGR